MACNIDFNIEKCDMYNSHIIGDSEVPPENSHIKSESFIISKEFHAKHLSIIKENIFESSDFCGIVPDEVLISSVQSSSIKNGFEEFENNSDSDDSLGLLSHLLKDFSSGDSLAFEKENCDINLNSTITVTKGAHKMREYEDDHFYENVMSLHNFDDFVASPNFVIPNARLTGKGSDDSPLCINSSIRFASTPIHETNYSYVIDEIFPSTENLSFVLQDKMDEFESENARDVLNEMTEIELNPCCVLPIVTNGQSFINGGNINPKPNDLNMTCVIPNPLCINENPLNKTFDKLDVSGHEKHNLSINNYVESDLYCKLETRELSMQHCDQYIQNMVPEKFDATNDFDSQKKCKNILSENKNILNTTFNAVKPLDTSINLSEDLEYKDLENEKVIPKNSLNSTVSYHKDAQNMIRDSTENFNTTYVEIARSSELETQSKMSPSMKTLDNNIKYLQPISKIRCKNSSSVLKAHLPVIEDKSKNKCHDLNKNLRKSVGCFDSTIVANMGKNKTTRRNSVTGSISRLSETNEVTSSYGNTLSVKCPVYRTRSSFSTRTLPKARRNSLEKENTHSKFESADSKNAEAKSVSKVELKNSNSLNKTVNTDEEVVKSITGAELKDINLINKTIDERKASSVSEVKNIYTSLFPELGKTVKKHSSSMRFYKKNSEDFSKVPSFKAQKKPAPPFDRMELLDKAMNNSVKTKSIPGSVLRLSKTSEAGSSYDATFSVDCPIRTQSSSFNKSCPKPRRNSFENGKSCLKSAGIENKRRSSVSGAKLKGNHSLNKTMNVDLAAKSVFDGKLKDGCLLNETITLNFDNEEKSVTGDELEGNHMSNKTDERKLNERKKSLVDVKNSNFSDKNIKCIPLIPELGKTVVKKPRNSMRFCKKSSPDFKLPSFKPQKKSVAPFEGIKLNAPAVMESKLKPSSNSDSTFDKTNPKKMPVFHADAEEEKKQKILRLPGKQVFSKKNVSTSIPLYNEKSGKFGKPNSISAVKPSSRSSISKMPLKSQKADCHLIQRADLNSTFISGSSSNSQQNNQDQKSIPKPASHIPLSRIPSVSQSNRKPASTGKSSLLAPRAGSFKYRRNNQS